MQLVHGESTTYAARRPQHNIRRFERDRPLRGGAAVPIDNLVLSLSALSFISHLLIHPLEASRHAFARHIGTIQSLPIFRRSDD